MSAPARVSIEVLKEAMRRHGGNVTAAADTCGMAPNNLRKRLEVAGIDVNAFRRPGGVRSIRKPGATRVRADHDAMFQEARFDLQYIMRQELTASDVLAMMLDEELAAWIKRKLETLRPGVVER